jgi:hypothetical protein
MGVLPAVEPEPCQLSDLRDFGVPNVYVSHVVQKCRTIESWLTLADVSSARGEFSSLQGPMSTLSELSPVSAFESAVIEAREAL